MTWKPEDIDWSQVQRDGDAVRKRYPEFEIPPFECNAGWHGILDRLLSEIREIIPPASRRHFRVRQVKEKFGGLRFHHGSAAALDGDRSDRIFQAVFAAECRADRACDVCGKPGLHQVNRGWHMTRCEEHADGGVPSPSPEEQAAFVPELKRSDGTLYVFDHEADTVRVVYPPVEGS